MILHSSKTHSIGDRPQSVKLTSTDRGKHRSSNKRSKPVPVCPFDNLQRYINVRPKFKDPMEPFFVFGDNRGVSPNNARKTLHGKAGKHLTYYLLESQWKPSKG